MSRSLVVGLCCLLALAAVSNAPADQKQDAVTVVREFAGALASGDIERAASYMTPVSVLFLSSAVSIAPPPGMTEKTEPTYFGTPITDRDVAAIRCLLDAMVLSRAARIEPGEPVRTAQGIRVPVTIELKTEILVTETQGQPLVDIAGQYPDAIAAFEEVARRSREAAQKATCLSNLKQLALAMLMYATDHDQRLPDAATWTDDLLAYMKSEELLHCPADANRYSYGMNSQLSGVSLADVAEPQNTVMLFESSSGQRNAADPLTSLCDPPRHGDGNNFAYVDGHAKFGRTP